MLKKSPKHKVNHLLNIGIFISSVWNKSLPSRQSGGNYSLGVSNVIREYYYNTYFLGTVKQLNSNSSTEDGSVKPPWSLFLVAFRHTVQ